MTAIYLNLVGYYLGAHLLNISASQPAAKSHEPKLMASFAQMLIASLSRQDPPRVYCAVWCSMPRPTDLKVQLFKLNGVLGPRDRSVDIVLGECCD